MAGRGPAPKDPSQRRNHHAPQRGEWVDLPPLEQPVLPKLPPRQIEDDDGNLIEVAWPQRTLDAWEDWREDPVTQMYSRADIRAAIELAYLHASLPPSKANEVRLRMDGLGLTPKGKRDLRWRVQSAAALDPVPARRGRRASRTTANRRARLTAVE